MVFKKPIFRYGYSYIKVFRLTFALIIAYSLKNLVIINQKKITTAIILISFLTLSTKQFNRINKDFNTDYLNKPWQNIFHILRRITK